MNSVYSVFHLGISAPDYSTAPMLLDITNPNLPKISITVARYVRYMQKEGHASYETISKDVRYIAFLFDYYVLIEKKREVENLSLFLEDFLSAFDKGSVLNWRAASKQSYSYCKNAINQFCKFVYHELQQRKVLPNEEQEITNALNLSYNYSSHMKTSLLFHIKRNSNSTRKKQIDKPRGFKRLSNGTRAVKYFPPEFLPLLVEETVNIRDKIILLMLGYGGRRQSEILHIFVNDITPQSNMLNVRLAHPISSQMKWLSRVGNKVTGTRAEYLKSMFNLKPRNELGKLSKSVGWKGIKFDDEGAGYSNMYFLYEEVEKYLLYLHVIYMRETRGKHNHHPYYFVDQFGDPLSRRALANLIDAACIRIEKKYGINLEGRRGHSLRHHYGYFCADILQMDILMIRKFMGHMQLASSAIYTHISPENARQAIANSRDRAKLEERLEATLEERIEIQKRFANKKKAISKLPDSWKQSWLSAVEIDKIVNSLKRGINK